jgi:hypothetical protein
MRGRRLPHFFILIAAICGFVGAAAGQTTSPASADAGTVATSSASLAPTAKVAQKAPSAASVQNGSQDSWTQQDQPVSLGEMARRARAQKNSQAKAVRIFDDENMPRAPISAGEKAPDFSGQGGGASSSGKVTICRRCMAGEKWRL